MPQPKRARSLTRLTLCALFAAVLCILSPIAIPIGPIPMTLGLFGVLLAAASLPPLSSTLSVAVFLLLGLCGLPVFSGGGSASALLGPVGGYLWSYLLCAPLVSLLTRRIAPQAAVGVSLIRGTLACLAGTLLCYTCGTLQFIAVTRSSPLSALLVCVLPFLPLDLLKCLLAASVSRRLRQFLACR